MVLSWLRRRMKRRSQRAQPGHLHRAGFQPRLEALESRRLLSAGDLDVSFGTGGRVTTDLGANDVGAAVAVQPNGQIVVVGSTAPVFSSHTDFALARYNADGSLDTAFGTGGTV